MSVSTQAESHQAEPREDTGKFWLISLTCHILAFLLLAWLLPVKEIILGKKNQPKADIKMRDEELADLVDRIRDIQADRMRERVALLGAGTDRMRVNLLNKQRNFTGFENTQRAAAHERISKRMKEVGDLHKKRVDIVKNYSDPKYIEDHSREMEVIDAQLRDVIDDIDASLPLLPKGDALAEIAAEGQQAVVDIGYAANFYRWTIGAINTRINTEKELEKWKNNADLPKLKTEVEKIDKQYAEVEQQLVEVKKDPEKKKETKKLEAELKKIGQQKLKSKGSLDRKEKQVKENIERYEERLTAQKNEESQKRKEVIWWDEKVRTSMEKVQNGFAKNFTAEVIEKDIKAAAEAVGNVNMDELITQPDEYSAPYENLEKMDLVGLFEKSDELIVKVCTDYRTFKAIELSVIKNLAFEKALEQISPVEPLPTKVDKSLLRDDLTNPELIEKHKGEIERVKASVEEKIELAERLLSEIEKIQQKHINVEFVEEQTLEDRLAKETFDEMQKEEQKELTEEQKQDYKERMEEQSAYLKKLQELAREDETIKYKDLAEMMKKDLRRQIDIKDLTEKDKKSEQGKMPPPTLTPDTPGILARKIKVDGVPTNWMYIDTWYTIGPFPNEGRRHLNTKFPPENVIDLNATYIGKNEREIKWTFMQAGKNMSRPANDEEYAIYYAYTEVYSDKPRDVWLAVGSDDKANVWLNEKPIWISGDRLKGWKINEGFRKVHLEEGFNRILYRVENGHLGVAFSMSIHVVAEGAPAK